MKRAAPTDASDSSHATPDKRLRQEHPPGKVIFVTQCQNWTEDTLRSMCAQHGNVVAATFVNSSCTSAFVEFETIEAATRCVDYFEANPNGGKFLYSNRQKVIRKDYNESSGMMGKGYGKGYDGGKGYGDGGKGYDMGGKGYDMGGKGYGKGYDGGKGHWGLPAGGYGGMQGPSANSGMLSGPSSMQPSSGPSPATPFGAPSTPFGVNAPSQPTQTQQWAQQQPGPTQTQQYQQQVPAQPVQQQPVPSQSAFDQHGLPNSSPPPVSIQAPFAPEQPAAEEPLTGVIALQISNVKYPVNVPMISQIFKAVGVEMRKIQITLMPGDIAEALVEVLLTDVSLARTQLDGQDIYEGCNHITTTVSSITKLDVHVNNDMSFSWVQPKKVSLLGLGPKPPSLQQPPIPTPQQQPQQNGLAPFGTQPQQQFQQQANPYDQYGQPQQQQSQYGQPQQQQLSQFDQPPNSMNGYSSGPPQMQQNQQMQGHGHQGPNSQTAFPQGYMPQGMNIMLVRGLPLDLTPDDVANLFVVYGNVQKVKIMNSKREMALVQLETTEQCNMAIQNLDNIKFRDSQLRVTSSKPDQVITGNPSLHELCGDYSAKPDYNRKTRPNQRPPNRPCAELFVSNLTRGSNEQDVMAWLERESRGYKRSAFKWIDEQKTQIVVEYDSLDAAIMVMMRCAMKEFNGRTVRIGFGKGSTRPIRDGQVNLQRQ